VQAIVYCPEERQTIGVARGCSGCTFTPRAAKKIFEGVIYRENV